MRIGREAIPDEPSMNPPGRPCTHSNEYSVPFRGLWKDRRAHWENGQNRLRLRRTGAQIHAGTLDETDVFMLSHELGFGEHRVGHPTSAPDERERGPETIFIDLTFGLLEFCERRGNLRGTPPGPSSIAVDLDACHGERGDRVRARMVCGEAGLGFDEGGLGRLEIGLQPLDLLHPLCGALGLGLSK